MVTGQITEQEYLAAHALHRRGLRKRINMIGFGAIVLGGAALFVFPPKAGVLLVCAALGGLLGESIQSRLVLPARLRRLYAQVRGRVDITLDWDDEKLILTSEYGQAARRWNDFVKAKESQDLILLYFNDALFEIVAKRWFNDADLRSFRMHVHFVD